MKVLVTGASGMMGANLCLRLTEKGIKVRALTRAPLSHPLLKSLSIEQAIGDLNDVAALYEAMKGCDCMYHAAGLVSYHSKDAKALYDVNLQGMKNVLKAAVDFGMKRIVYTSSTAAIGIPEHGASPLNERGIFAEKYAQVPYMHTKNVAEELAFSYPGIEVVVVNPATIYGAGDVKGNTGFLFKKIRHGKILFIPPGGTAVVSVRDCVEGHLLAMEHGKPGQKYILSEGNYSYDVLLRTIAEIVHGKAPHYKIPSTLFPLAYNIVRLLDFLQATGVSMPISRHMVMIAFAKRYFDASKAKMELGWQPTQTLPEMLTEAADFYQREGMLGIK